MDWPNVQVQAAFARCSSLKNDVAIAMPVRIARALQVLLMIFSVQMN
jgi:hypothetical protein